MLVVMGKGGRMVGGLGMCEAKNTVKTENELRFGVNWRR